MAYGSPESKGKKQIIGNFLEKEKMEILYG